MSRRITRASLAKENDFINGSLEDSKETTQVSSPPFTPKPVKKAAARRRQAKGSNASDVAIKTEEPITLKSSTNHVRKATKVEDDPDELPHGLGRRHGAPEVDPIDETSPAKKQRSTPKSTKSSIKPATGSGAASSSKGAASKGKKKNNYGHTWGVTPHPDWKRPTPEECHEVTRLLMSLHDPDRKIIKTLTDIPVASLNVAGCGNVPHVMDALCRVRLSANTTNKNANTAHSDAQQAFGVLKDPNNPHDQGSVDWDAVRKANVGCFVESIRRGGLADRKGKDIKGILDLVYEENKPRLEAFRAQLDTDGNQDEPKDLEFAIKQNFRSGLDHLHLLSTQEAVEKLIEYPGIGIKSAACVALFCMQRPCFAVDTHVFRLCKWLGWVPPTATRDSTFSHLEIRVPDELKYALHQLLIKHGQRCQKCRAITGEDSAGWDEPCVIEELVKRTGGRKGGSPKKGKAKGSGGSKKRAIEDSDEDDDEYEEYESPARKPKKARGTKMVKEEKVIKNEIG